MIDFEDEAQPLQEQPTEAPKPKPKREPKLASKAQLKRLKQTLKEDELALALEKRKKEKTAEAMRLANVRANSAERLKPHHFKKGQSGNPTGQRGVWYYYQKRLRNYTPEIIDKLLEILRNGRDSHALIAAEMLLNRAWGKPKEEITLNANGSTGIPQINITIGQNTEIVPGRETIDITPGPKKALGE